MDDLESTQENGIQPENIPPVYRNPKILSAPVNTDTFKSFFRVTGGSSLYCLSAVFIAYGIVMVLKPILAGSTTLRDAVPCLLTLHGYELALLGVLALIVFKKVVDDAISLAVLMSLFMVGTSIALGSVADRGIREAVYWGIAGIILVLLKVCILRWSARVPFKALTIAGLLVIMAYNYLGPAVMAHFTSVHPTDEVLRRDIWLWLYIVMLGGGIIVWLQAVRGKTPQSNSHIKTAFLQSAQMVYLLAVIIVAGAGIHQYTMAFAFTLERVLLDYVPVVAVVCLLLIEVLRYAGKQHTVVEIGITLIPLALTLYAIYEKSVLSSGRFSPGLLCYPPVMLAIIGILIATLAFYRRCRWLWISVCGYGLGIVLTVGFSPAYPYQLNILACGAILVTALFIFGILCRNPYLCLAAIVMLSGGLPLLDHFSTFVEKLQLTEFGCIAGFCGLGILAIYLLFNKTLHQLVSVLGAIMLAGFLLDFLPEKIHWQYLAASAVIILLLILLWLRTRNFIVISILCIPFFIKIYIMGKQLAAWRYVIVGFVLLGVGAVVSLFKKTNVKEVDISDEISTSAPIQE